jgi:hypothetical protein
VILNTLNGDANVLFFRLLNESGVTLPTVSLR